jgi:glycosyltransferase involved in cell wall biosynthesis
LLAALDVQEFPNYEVLLVDDGSTDETWEILEQWQGERRVALRAESPSGSYAARNRGWRAASGRLVAFTDDDCVPDRQWIASLCEAVSNEEIVGAQGVTLASPGEITPFTHQIEQTVPGPPYRTCNILYRRSELQRQGGFQELQWYADNIFGLRARQTGAIAFAPRAVVFHPPRPRKWRSRSDWLQHFRADELHRKELRELGEERLAAPDRVLPVILWIVRPMIKQSAAHARFAIRHQRSYMSGIGPMLGEKIAMLLAMRDFWRSPRSSASEPVPALSADSLVSVVILTRDRPALLEQTLDAIERQTYSSREIIVADNGDGSALEMSKRYGGHAIHVPGLSLGAARQAAVDISSGEILAFTDDDCLPAPQWLCRIVSAFRTHPDWHGVQGRTEAARGPLDYHTVMVSAPNLLFETCNMAYRAASLRRSGGFDPRFRFWFEDTSLAARVLSHGPIGWEPDAVVVHQAVPPRPMTADRWQAILSDERLLAGQYPSFYRRARAPFPLASIVLRALIGSPMKTLIRTAPRAKEDPRAYGRLTVRLLKDRMALLTALWETVDRRRS